MIERFERHTWAEIDLDALRQNFLQLVEKAGPLPLCAVVKADAYGHGAVQCAMALAKAGAAALAVSCLAEAVQLRRAGLSLPILILGYTEPAFAAQLIREKITQSCFSLEYAEVLSAAAVQAGGTVRVHLKADTGMGRLGFGLRADFEKAVAEMRSVWALPGLEVTGLFQHFAAADEAGEESLAYTEAQQHLFVRAYRALHQAGCEPQVIHCDNSAALLLHPDWPEGLPRERCMARPGILLYGFDPSDELRTGLFRPVMKLKTLISHIKWVAPGETVSYGRQFRADQPTRVATLCAGYADGYPRLLSSGAGVVEIRGQACPVLGRVCMDQTMVDVSALPEDLHPGEEAILWGGAVSDSAETIARKTGTISYEVLCGVSRRVPRLYLEGGAPVAAEDGLNG